MSMFLRRQMKKDGKGAAATASAESAYANDFVLLEPLSAKHKGKVDDAFLAEALKRSQDGKEVVFAVMRKNPNLQFVGCAVLHDVQSLTPELGLMFSSSKEGKRYARKAACAMKHWAEGHLQHKYIVYPVAQGSMDKKIPEAAGGVVAGMYKPKSRTRQQVSNFLEYRIYNQKALATA